MAKSGFLGSVTSSLVGSGSGKFQLKARINCATDIRIVLRIPQKGYHRIAELGCSHLNESIAGFVKKTRRIGSPTRRGNSCSCMLVLFEFEVERYLKRKVKA